MSPPLEQGYICLSTSFKQTELRLGLPGSESPDRVNGSGLSLGLNLKWGSGFKRPFSDAIDAVKDVEKKAPGAKAQVVGWPPIRNSRKNIMAGTNNLSKDKEYSPGCIYVKVSMDGAPYLRKVDLKTYSNYKELSLFLEKMFSCFTIGQCYATELVDGSENVLTYEDEDGDWMLVGDVPWNMFTETCRRLRILKGSDAIGLDPRAMEKSKHRN